MVGTVFLCACVYMPVCLRVRVCVGTHPSVTLPQTSGASPFLTRAAQSPNLIAHTPLYCTNLNATEKNLHCFSLTSDTFFFISVFSP